jgi:hypothetical protein
MEVIRVKEMSLRGRMIGKGGSVAQVRKCPGALCVACIAALKTHPDPNPKGFGHFRRVYLGMTTS